MSAHVAELSVPSEWVTRFGSELNRSGRILDVACGSGRHARWFAKRGHPVVAMDVDPAALQSLTGLPEVESLCIDLENGSWPLAPSEKFSAVVVANYLHRPLFPVLLRAIDVGGILIYETFALGNELFGRPTNPEFLLRPGELLEVVRDALRVIAYEDVLVMAPKAAAVQRICARRE